MRIEISSSGFGGAAVSELQSNLVTFIGDAESVISSFKTVKENTFGLNGGAGSLQGALVNVDSRLRTEEIKVQEAKTISKKVDDFVSLAARVDEVVSRNVNRNKNEFYRVNQWMKPSQDVEEAAWYEKVWDWLCDTPNHVKDLGTWIYDGAKKLWQSACDFYTEHKELIWKITGTILIVAGVILTIAAVISTGGAALAGLVPLLMSLGVAESVATTISAAVAITAIVSTVGSGVMNIVDLWAEIDNDLFTGIQSALSIVSFATTFVYTIGSSVSKRILESTAKPNQIHHYATNKSGTYTSQFEEITHKYGLDLDCAWNKELLPHQGKHPSIYHEYVLDLMEQIDQIAQGDTELFLQLYEEMVKDTVRSNPAMLYSEYWINAEYKALTGAGESIISKILGIFGR